MPGGKVVGRYQDRTGKVYGWFLHSGENFTSISFPGAAATDARGIDPGGDIVGIATDPWAGVMPFG